MNNEGSPLNAAQLAQTAVDVGSVDSAAIDSVREAIAVAAPDLGIHPSAVEANRVFLVSVDIDDSGSMDGHKSMVRESLELLLTELQETAEEADDCEILIAIRTLHHRQIQPYVPVGQCLHLTDENHSCGGGTPLISQAKESLGTLLAKVAELSEGGRSTQSFTVFMSDGQADEDERRNEALIRTVRELVVGMTQAKQHIVCAVSIGGSADATFRQMGIVDKWILRPAKDPFAFKDAIRKVSRASRAASKGGGAFRSIATGGIQGATDGFR